MRSSLSLQYGSAYHLASSSPANRGLSGSEHPQAAISLNNLALLYEAQGNYEKAKQLYQSALAIRCKMMGRDNPKVRLTEQHYATLLKKMGLYNEAERIEIHIQTVSKGT